MPAKIIDGKAISAEIRGEVKNQVETLKQHKITPCLAVILVGVNPASKSYVRSKVRACEEISIKFIKIEIASNASKQDLLDEIDKLNRDTQVHGILVQLPLLITWVKSGLQSQLSQLKMSMGFTLRTSENLV